MTRKLFGGSKETSTQNNVSGYGALPAELQNYFKDIASKGSDVMSNASEYFAPQDINSYEQAAANMILPENFQAGIENYLNPFRDIITQDVNKAFEGEFGALKQRADEAGAFGGSRYRMGQGDLERSRLDSIIAGLAGQFNNAAGQMQTGIGNLLGFGGLQRGVDLAQRQATPAALSFYSDLIKPLLSGSSGSQYTKSTKDAGIFSPMSLGQAAGAIGSGIGAVSSFFSDCDLKENIRKIGRKNGFNIYQFNYKGCPRKYHGVMAQEVMEVVPNAVARHKSGYLMVDYNRIGLKMECVA